MAKAQKVSVASLVKAMVKAAEAELAAAVKAGSMTQAQADTMRASLTQRITDQVNHVRPDRGHLDADKAPSTSGTSTGTMGTTPGAV